MVNPNSWYIAMHLDRLNEELLSDAFGKKKKKKIIKKEFDNIKEDEKK